MMHKVFLSVLSPLASILILMLGVGLFNTLVTIRLEGEGASLLEIGFVNSAYYAGIVLGAFRIAPFIMRVGHIRAYAAFASITAVVTLLQGLIIDPWVWVSFRLIGGYCIAGLYIVVESWMLGVSTPKTRGQLLAIYMIVLYGSVALGQFLLNIGEPNSLTPFAIATILSSLSVVPLAISKTSHPKIEEPSALTVKELYHFSPTGVMGCFCSGLLLGALYSHLPLFTQQTSSGVSGTALIMFFTVIGGMALQYPAGHLSDNFDRRKILIILSALTVGLCICIAFVPRELEILNYILMFVFGGFSFAIYPVSISHACDVLEQKDIVAATQGLVLAYGVGSVLGPLSASGFMKVFGPLGLFIFFALLLGFLAVFFFRRVFVSAPVHEEAQHAFVTLPTTTPIAAELDPRSDE